MTRPIYCSVMKNWEKHNNPYNWESWCALCKSKKLDKSFKEDEEFVRVDVEVTCMRWDDEVLCFHKKCFTEWKEYLKKRFWDWIRI